MSNSVDPDTSYDEPSHLDLRCLQKPIVTAYGSERVKRSHHEKRGKYFHVRVISLDAVFIPIKASLTAINQVAYSINRDRRLVCIYMQSDRSQHHGFTVKR